MKVNRESMICIIDEFGDDRRERKLSIEDDDGDMLRVVESLILEHKPMAVIDVNGERVALDRAMAARVVRALLSIHDGLIPELEAMS